MAVDFWGRRKEPELPPIPAGLVDEVLAGLERDLDDPLQQHWARRSITRNLRRWFKGWRG